MAKQRVVITGLGAITPIGNTWESTWQALVAGTSGIGPITLFDAKDLTTRIAGEVKEFDPTLYMDRKDAGRLDRFTQFAGASAFMAVQHSKLDLKSIDLERAGVIFGSGIGGLDTFEKQHSVILTKGPRRVSPFFIPMLIADMSAGFVSMMFGFKGPNFSTVSACASGAHAIGEAYRCLQYGDADIILAGGAEATVVMVGMAGFCSARALSQRNDEPQRASRPFDAHRDGFVMGEGSATLVLETLESAQRRNATIYAEIIGYGRSGDAYHMTAPAPNGEGSARAMKCALKDAGIVPQDVDYINAHGTSTELNDKFETMAIKSVLGEHAYRVAINSTKSMTGHLLGAAGALELAVCVNTINHGLIHPTINYETPDPECDLNYTPNQAVKKDVRLALSNSLGFGGHNVCLAIKKFQE
jgi:3-oxoacyl-[acyl-carrier-protein] synthase II